MMDAPALKIENLFKSYGKKSVIKGLNLEIMPGEIFGLIGKNGIGKSTTIDCAVGSKLIDSGDIYIDGLSIRNKPIEAKKKFGYVPSEPCLYENMSGYEYMAFIASIYGLSKDEYVKNLELLSKKFDLKPQDLSSRIKGYSHGMKQKLGLMSSIIHNPRVWILDEPTVGLDVMVYENLVQAMKDFASSGNAILVTSHNLDMVAKICNRIGIINNGVIAKMCDLTTDTYSKDNLTKVFFDTYKEN